MQQTSFMTFLTPLTALPLVLGLIIGVWGSLTIVAQAYGVDLARLVPWISMTSVTWTPIIAIGVTVIAFARGQKLRDLKTDMPAEAAPRFGPLSLLERTCLVGAGIGAVAIPYMLKLPVPELWVFAVGIFGWFGWRRFAGT